MFLMLCHAKQLLAWCRHLNSWARVCDVHQTCERSSLHSARPPILCAQNMPSSRHAQPQQRVRACHTAERRTLRTTWWGPAAWTTCWCCSQTLRGWSPSCTRTASPASCKTSGGGWGAAARTALRSGRQEPQRRVGTPVGSRLFPARRVFLVAGSGAVTARVAVTTSCQQLSMRVTGCWQHTCVCVCAAFGSRQWPCCQPQHVVHRLLWPSGTPVLGPACSKAIQRA